MCIAFSIDGVVIKGFTTTTGSAFSLAGHQTSTWELLAFGGLNAFSANFGASATSIISGSRCRAGLMNVTRSPMGWVGSTLIVTSNDHEIALRTCKWQPSSDSTGNESGGSLAECTTRYVTNRWLRVTFVKQGWRDRKPLSSTTGIYHVTCEQISTQIASQGHSGSYILVSGMPQHVVTRYVDNAAASDTT